MKVLFKDHAEEEKPKVDYGTILLCKEYECDDDYDLYRVAQSHMDDFGDSYELDTIHDRDGKEDKFFGNKFESTSELIGRLRNSYRVIQAVDAHIVIDKIVGRL